MNIEVREAARGEYSEVARLTEAAYEQYAERLGPERWSVYREELTDIEGKAKAGAATFIALMDEKPAGAVSLFRHSPEDRPWPKDWTFVRALAVAPEHRGKGIGRRLLEVCIARTREWGAPVIFLRTAPYMKEAIALYGSMGFEKNEEYSEVLPNGRKILAYMIRM